MKWRRRSPGIYDSEEGHVFLTYIPGHWEVAVGGDPENGFGADAWDARTLAEAKAMGEDAIDEARKLRGEP